MRVGAIEPVGIIKASATNDLKSNARMKATARLSRVSLKTCGGGVSSAVCWLGSGIFFGLEFETDILVMFDFW
jgi:hypothetical protein